MNDRNERERERMEVHSEAVVSEDGKVGGRRRKEEEQVIRKEGRGRERGR